MANENSILYSRLLDRVARELDISPSKYKTAIERYLAVGSWLEAAEYDGCCGIPHICPQGSFRLGTVVRPFREGKDSDYDIDLVCTLQALRASTSPAITKLAVGTRLKEHAVYKSLLEQEWARCWTISYAEADGIGFHVDVLPSALEDQSLIAQVMSSGVPEELAAKAVAITHKHGSAYSWSPSNPDGYADWFDRINRPAFLRVAPLQKSLLLQENRSVYAGVEEIPDQLVRTPLQRAIQILKRHRDIRFAGHELEDAKPISIIITTLAARLYQQEGDTYAALSNIVTQLGAHSSLLKPGATLDECVAGLGLIGRKADDTWFIPNPVNPAENFADLWHEGGNRKARAFFQWVSWVRSDLVDILSQPDVREISKSLEQHLGQGTVQSAAKDIGFGTAAGVVCGSAAVSHVSISAPRKPWGIDAKRF